MIHYAALLLVATSTMASPQATVISPLLLNPPQALEHLHQDPLQVTVRFENTVHAKLLTKLEELGAEIKKLPSGKPVVVGEVVSIRIPKMHIKALLSIPEIVRVESAIPITYAKPLYDTSRQVEANQLWWPAEGRKGTMGEGITIADIESAWDIFHPDYFNPDGGYVAVRDTTGDGMIGPGDEVDVDGDKIFESTLSILESGLEEGYQPDLDWLYVDENQDRRRNFSGSNVTDATPGFGEPIFIGDDINQDGMISGGEKLVRLGSSKVKALYDGSTIYKRGENLSQYPRNAIQENISWNFMSHGTGAAGIAVAGWPGLRRHTGVAPAADLILINDQDKVGAIALAQELGADVVFHEWNDWQNFQDGSTNIDEAVSSAAQTNQVQVAPAGNLANASHIMNLEGISENPQTISLSTNGFGWHQYQMFTITFTWRGSLDDVEIGIRDGDGVLQKFQAPYTDFNIQDMRFQSWHDVSTRGTSMVTVYAGLIQGGILEERNWDLEISGSQSVEKVRGVVLDDRSGWGQGVSWTTHVSDFGSALSPATADTVIAVGAHGGVEDQGDWGRVGYRRAWSGMGPRIDGERVVDISSPDDPMVCSSADNDPDFYAQYGRFGGTSGATPHVAGVAALMLSTGTFQNHQEIEDAITGKALQDEATGEVPNEAYGFGKIRSAQATFGESIPQSSRTKLKARATRNEICEMILSVETETNTDRLSRVEFDIWYNGVFDPSENDSIVLPPVATEIPVVVRVTGQDGTPTRELFQIDPSQYPCEITPAQAGGCRAQRAPDIIVFTILLLTLGFLRRRPGPSI